MIDRYTRPEIGAIFSEQRKYEYWLRIEILAVKARMVAGEVPKEDFDQIQQKAAFDVDRIADLEAKTRHDVAAFVDNVAENVGPAARHLHYGMTSSDVLDTALALQLKDASTLILRELSTLIASVIRRAREHQDTVMPGRTHGVHAEPTTFGLKLSGWAFELERARERLELARDAVAVGKLSGVVGTYSQLPPSIEEFVCSELGLRRDDASTQVVSRDRHAEFVAAIALLGGTLERIATEIRHLARTEVREVEEPFHEGEQKGSSAMPHKRNPVRCERLTGLARLVRAAVVPAIENVALWHERDISHSSVERVMLADVCIATDFMLAELREIIDGMLVYPERMRENLDRSHGLVFSQSILLALIDSGLTRDEAYRVTQEAAMSSWKEGRHLREVLAEHPEASQRLSREDIERCLDESRYLKHAREVIDRLEGIDR